MRKFHFCLFVLLLPSSLLEAQIIKIDVQKGQKYLFESSLNLTVSNDIGGNQIKINSEHRKIIVYEVIATGENKVSFQQTVTRIISNSATSGIIEDETTYDSDIDIEGPESELQSKNIGTPKKIVIDNDGYMVKQNNNEKIYLDDDGNIVAKQDTTGKYESPITGWDLTRSQSSTDLFIPFFIGKEFKPGVSFSYLDSFIIEKNSTSFSINKEKMDTRDSGTYTITDIENGIATISYTGTKIFSMVMKMMGKPMNSTSKSIVRSEIRLDINTGMVMSKTTVEESTIYPGNSDNPTSSTSKNTSTVKVTLVQ